MSVDGKDEIELQDALNRIQIFLQQYNEDVFTEEEAYNNIKKEVTK